MKAKQTVQLPLRKYLWGWSMYPVNWLCENCSCEQCWMITTCCLEYIKWKSFRYRRYNISFYFKKMNYLIIWNLYTLKYILITDNTKWINSQPKYHLMQHFFLQQSMLSVSLQGDIFGLLSTDVFLYEFQLFLLYQYQQSCQDFLQYTEK